jgi:alpha-glucuronidase
MLKPVLRVAFIAMVLLGMLHARRLYADSSYHAWLRYAPLSPTERAKFNSFPTTVVVVGDSTLLKTSQTELLRGARGMLGRSLLVSSELPKESAILLGTVSRLHSFAPELSLAKALAGDDFSLMTTRLHGHECIVIEGNTDRGVLYGVFALLRKIAFVQGLSHLDEAQQPSVPLRWVNQWDNLDGSIERGYGGSSIFFADGNVRTDLTRAADYARLLASVGINGCVVNNVNANPRVLSAEFLPQLARIADAFRPWGVRLAISVDLSSPKALGELDTFDPLDPRVAAWWSNRAEQIYHLVPDFGGFLVKADSEGRSGPATYHRTPADAANVIADALKPHGGVIFYRAFVYNHHLDWRDPKADRAKAAYDIFHPLDGKFNDNVIIQIKNGPIDFQVREPASSLFGGLERTNQAIELQITQEYTGQQRHLCFLVPMWKQTLDFDMHVAERATPVKELVAGKSLHRPHGGFAGVANVGLDSNWLDNPMAMANLYGFARLAWDPNLSAENIVDEWTRLTFGNDPFVVHSISEMQLSSWRIYESYSGPLGAGTLTDILGPHYGPGIASSENNGWGQWHRADREGVGMDRSMATGTGYVGQYAPEVQKLYETTAATPDSLLLFFHHVPYSYKLRSGKTVIQDIYDSHYQGAGEAQDYVRKWKSLHDHMDDDRYAAVLKKLEYQAGHAIVWRDAVCSWFFHTSGIPDTKGRVGHYPNRIEAESMQLQGYTSIEVQPAETASGGKAIACEAPRESCTATFQFNRPAGQYELDIQYFDQNNGKAKFRVLVGDRLIEEWLADDNLPSAKLGGDTSTRRGIANVALHPGDNIRIEGTPDGGDLAALDYVEIVRSTQQK